jgi:hypothetical protein
VQIHSGCTRMQSLAGVVNKHQVVEEGREVVVERGLNQALSHLTQGQFFVL